MNEQTNEENTKSFPGYPHYPANEDIMNSKSNERVDLDVENLSRSKSLSTPPLPAQQNKPATSGQSNEDSLDEEDIENVHHTDADITPDDLIALGAEEAIFGNPTVLPAEDLDVPGSEEDDANEEIGEEDEENNYYSLGGDAHEDLEEDKS